MTHAHMTAWALALILFVVAYFLRKTGKAKGAKIVQMILRVTYLLIIGTGLHLLFGVSGNMLATDLSLKYIVKILSGIWVIAAMEMILVKTAKNKPAAISWVQLAIAFALALYLGFNLPIGM